MKLRTLIISVIITLAVCLTSLSAQNPIQLFFGSIPWVTGNGTVSTGTPRVTLASDSTGQVTANAGTNLNTSTLATEATLGTRLTESDFDTKTGSLTEGAPATDTASSGLNGRLQRIAQRLTTLLAVFPTTLTLNGGAADASTLRVAPDLIRVGGTAVVTAAAGVQKVGVVGNANAAFDAATGAAPPANVLYIGGLTTGATGGLLTGIGVCDSQALLNMTTATTTEIVALVSSRTVRVCAWQLMANGTTTATWQRGTGSACGTGTTAISPGFNLTAQVGFAVGNGIGSVLDTSSGNALCLTNSAAVNLQGFVRYAVY